MRLSFSPRSQQPDTMMTPRDSRARRRGQRRRDTACRLLVEPLEGRALLSAGALDTTFGGTGIVVTAEEGSSGTANYSVNGIAIQPDLKTVAAGLDRPTSTASVYTTAVLRYNADGSLDTSFGSGGVVEIATNSSHDVSESFKLHNVSVALQTDGKVVVATNTQVTTQSGTKTDMMVLRLNADGSLDTSFGSGGESVIDLPQGSATPGGVAVLTGGQIVVAGSNPNSVIGPEFVVARLTSSGALDSTFGPNGQGYDYTAVSQTGGTFAPLDTVDALGVDASGDLVLAGRWTDTAAQTNPSHFQVVRYTPGGLLDATFGNQGVTDLSQSATYGIESVGFQPDGHIILGLPCYNGVGTGGAARLNTNGTLDTTFGTNGFFADPAIHGYVVSAVQPDGKVLLDFTNQSTGTTYQVDRLLPGGMLDSAFGSGGDVVVPVPGVSSVGTPVAIAVGPDRKITSAGRASTGSDLDAVTFRLLGDAPITGQVAVTQQPPASLTAGTPFGLSIEVDDSSGNLESSFNGTVTVALANNPGGATLGGTLTVTATNGVASFSGLTLTRAASGYTLDVTGNSLGDAVTTAVTVTPAGPTQVVVTQQPPSSVTAGSGFGLQAAIEDAYGNVVSTASGTVSVALASNPGGTTLGGTLSATTSNGVATFSGLTLTKAASGYSLSVSSSGLTGSTSAALTVTPAAATQLVITQQPPASVVVNSAFGVQVAVEDTYGNVVTNASNTVKVAFANNPTGAKLGGTLSVKANQGVASFSGLTINKVGTGYTLQLSSTGLTGAVTNAINVTKTAPSIALPAKIRADKADPSLDVLLIEGPGLWDGIVPKKRPHST